MGGAAGGTWNTPAPGPGRASSAVAYHRVTLPDGTALSLADRPPRSRADDDSAALVYRRGTGLVLGDGGGTLAVLDTGAKGGLAACLDAATRTGAATPVPAAGLTAGTRVCVTAAAVTWLSRRSAAAPRRS
ncbi:hypothetical protein [Streptomyces sp. NPDC001070]